MLIRTNEPARDFERYADELDAAFERCNNQHKCAVCGEPCGADDHYEIFDGVYACSHECARKIVEDEDMIDEIVGDWIEDHKIGPCPLR